jgi:hypothetical protein
MERVILRVETTCNTSDRDLIRNLEATKARGANLVPFSSSPKSEPLFICGSGPSLLEYFKQARPYAPQAKVMALNGAYKALIEAGYAPPDYYCQLDARGVNVNFLEFLGDREVSTTFLLASQCSPEMFKLTSGRDVQVFHLNTPTTHKVFPDEKVYFGGGSTVGLTAMGVAGFLGYRTLCLFGFDSSYARGKSHVVPQPQNEQQKTLDVWVHEREYLSTPTMAKQVEEFRPWLRALELVFPDIDVRLFGEGLFYDYILTGQQGSVSRETEAAKYVEMYKDPSYRMPPHRAEAILNILRDLPAGSLLDVGTGRGETLELARSCGFSPVAGTETVPELLQGPVVHGLLPNIPLPDRAADTVTCFEVIEHLLPVDVIPALRELERLADKRVVISAATRSDMRGGVELHPSWRTQREWEETFKFAWGTYADIRLLGNLSSCGLSPVYEYRLHS